MNPAWRTKTLKQTGGTMRCRIITGICSAMLVLMELTAFAGQAVSSEPCRCREDRELVTAGMTVALSCSGATERGKTLHAEEIVPVFREHHYGRGEAPVFNKHNPNRLRAVGRILLPSHAENSCFRGIILEGSLRTGDVVNTGVLKCVICSVVCDNIQRVEK